MPKSFDANELAGGMTMNVKPFFEKVLRPMRYYTTLRESRYWHMVLGVGLATSLLCGNSQLLAAPQESTEPVPVEQEPVEQAPAEQQPVESTPVEPSATETEKSLTATTTATATSSPIEATAVIDAEGGDKGADSQAEIDQTSSIDILGTPPAPEMSVLDKSGQESSAPLRESVPLYEKDRPEWLFKSPTVEDGKIVLFVGGELCADEKECERKHQAALYSEVCNYFDDEVCHQSYAAISTPLTGEFIARRWVNDEENYLAKVQTSEGTFYQLWSKVRIDEEGLRTMKQWHLSNVQPTRIGTLGIGLLTVLSGIGVIHLGAGFTARRTRSGSR